MTTFFRFVLPLLPATLFFASFQVASAGEMTPSVSGIANVEILETPTLSASEMYTGEFSDLVIEPKNPPFVVEKDNVECDGGLDEGSAGDRQTITLASPRDARWGGGTANPEEINLYFKTKDQSELQIAVGYLSNEVLTHRVRILLDDEEICVLKRNDEEPIPQELKTIVLSVYPSDTAENLHKLTIQQTDFWGCFIIDAIQIYGTGVQLLDLGTKEPVDLSSASSPKGSSQPHLPANFTLPENARAFNFGPADSPIWDQGNFKKVTNRTAYDPTLGFGWLSFAGLQAGNEGAAKGDPLRSSYVKATSLDTSEPWAPLAEFQIDLPPGTYRVFVIAGGLRWPKDLPWRGWPQMDIYVQNKRVWTASCIYMRDTFLDRPSYIHNSFEIQVDKGPLVLTFPPPYLILNGLIIYNTDEIEKVEPELDKLVNDYYLAPALEIDASLVAVAQADAAKRQQGKLESVEGAPETQAPSSEPQGAIPDAGYSIFPHDPFQAIQRAELPPATVPGVLPTLSSRMTPGEYRALTFSIHPFEDLNAVQVTASQLKDEKGNEISAADLNISPIGYVRRSATTRINGQWYWLPKLLLPNDEQNLPKGINQTFWITIHAPEAAVPGLYKGEVSISGPGIKNGLEKLLVEVEVLPFRLDRPEQHVGVFWSEARWYAYPDKMTEQFADMAEHGVTTMTTYGLDGGRMEMVDGKLQIDFTETNRRMKLRKEAGLNGPIPLSGGNLSDLGLQPNTPEFEKHYKEMIGLMVAAQKKNNWPELLIFPVDEPTNKPLMEKAKYYMQLIKSVPGAKTYVTGQPKGMEVFGDWLDVGCFNRWNEEDVEAMKSQGKTFSFYTSVYGNPTSVRISAGVGLWATGAGTMYFWAYNWTKGNPICDLDNNEAETGAVVCTPTGEPMSTTWWEGVREGANDLAYLTTLKNRIGKSSNSPWKERATTFLTTIQDTLGRGFEKQASFRAQAQTEPSKLKTWRNEAIDLILESQN